MSSEAPSHLLDRLVEKIALERTFATPGTDAGLLPINSLLMEMEEAVPAAAPPPEIRAAITRARIWLDQLLNTTVVFDHQVLRLLDEWQPWMTTAIDKWESRQPLPPVPAAWNSGAPTESTALAAATAASTLPHEPSIAINLTADSELLTEFVADGLEHLQKIEQGVLVLEEKPKDADTLNSIFRAFHTFKGGAGFLNLAAIKDLAHDSESLLDAARQGRLDITSPIIDLILASGDALKQFMAEISAQLAGKDPGQAIMVPTLALRARLQAVLASLAAKTAKTQSAPAPAKAQLEAAPAVPVAPPPAIQPVTPTPSPAVQAAPVARPAPSPAPPAKSADGRPKPPVPAALAAGFIKVDTTKLDGLIDQVGELMITQSMVVQDPHLRDLQSQHLTRNLAQLRRITNELQRTSMSLRMVPIRGAFQKMIRLVRDTAALQKKQVQLILNGEETEMDRNIVEEISDPLIHMIRNSVDHGIELPVDRVAKGKPAEGTIRLRAFHKGGAIVIQIEDDGAGLNQERILAKAIERGMVKPGESLTESEVFALIFAPGFSTAQKVTEISGRGVGMDVVQRNIEKLRGKVEIGSVTGQGSTFTIYLPLTLAIIDGLIVRTGSQRYVLPTLSVRESFRPTPAMISTLYERGEMVNVRGRLTPLLRLYQLFNTKPKTTDPCQAIVMVLESGQDTRCLMVDELIAKQEVVIKSLGEHFKGNRALAGAAILGDGKVGLILDVDSLVKIKTAAAAMAA